MAAEASITVPMSRVLAVLAVETRRVAGDRTATKALAATVMKLATAVRLQNEPK